MDGSLLLAFGAKVSETGVNCPVCGQVAALAYPADISRFLRVRCRIHPTTRGAVHLCEECEHAFFTPFLSSGELSRLYSGYQDDFYNQERVAIEPGYAGLVELFSDQDGSHWRSRWRFYDACFDPSQVQAIVDFGGGSGLVSRTLFPRAQVTVVDEDFERSGGDLAGVLGACDLLFAAHVFEHLPDPTKQLSRLASHMRTGAQAWIEVPKEYTGRLTDHFKGFVGTPPTAPLRVMHEHIAHFSKRSLRRMMELSGLAVTEVCMSDAGLMAVMGRKL